MDEEDRYSGVLRTGEGSQVSGKYVIPSQRKATPSVRNALVHLCV
jgi:hypothetical protein